MSLNIKNAEAHKLAQELANLTGESMATAVTIALKERLDRLQTKIQASKAERLRKLREDCGKRLEANKIDHGDLLYGKNGLPL